MNYMRFDMVAQHRVAQHRPTTPIGAGDALFSVMIFIIFFICIRCHIFVYKNDNRIHAFVRRRRRRHALHEYF